MKHPRFLTTLLLTSVTASFFAGVPRAEAFPRTKEKADVTLEFALNSSDPLSSASGTASVHITSDNGVETVSPLTLNLTGLAAGSYTVDATRASDGSIVAIGTATVGATPAPEELALPVELDPLDISLLTISDATPAILLSGTPTLDIATWIFSANVKVTAPALATTSARAGGQKTKKVHGHVLVHSKIIDNVEQKRKFLLVAHGAPADTTLTINLDGVAAGTLQTTKNGKMMAKELPSSVRIAGVRLLTLTDPSDQVVAEARFFAD